MATQAPDSAVWNYMTTSANPALAGSKIEVVVTDKPGNTTESVTTL